MTTKVIKAIVLDQTVDGIGMIVFERELVLIAQAKGLKEIRALKRKEGGWIVHAVIKGQSEVAVLVTVRKKLRVFKSFDTVIKIVGELCPELEKITVYMDSIDT